MGFAALKNAAQGWWRALHPATPDAAGERRPAPAATGFLPDFCSGPVIVNVVIIAEMLALVVTLVTRRISMNLIEDLLLISLFVQWIAITSVTGLCYARRYLNRLPNLRAFLMAYLLLLCIVFLVSEAAVWLLWVAGKIPSPQPEWHGYFHIQNLTVAAIVNALALRYLLGKHELRQRTESEARAKIQALQSRIRPHFVFSSLNVIASLTRSQPARAEGAIEDMADLFRMMLGNDESVVPVKKEIDVAKKYLALEQLRLDNRLTVDWDVGTYPRKAAVPVLTLQPLLENAIRYGIEPLSTGGTISIKLWEDNDKICIRVTNPVHFGKTKAAQGAFQSLADIKARLHSHYGDRATLEAAGENDRFSVTVALPTRGGES